VVIDYWLLIIDYWSLGKRKKEKGVPKQVRHDGKKEKGKVIVRKE